MKIEKKSLVTGSLYALLAFFFMAVFGILTKMALKESSVIWVSFIAYLSSTLVLGVFILPKGFSYLKSEHYYRLLGRAIFGCLASFLYSLSINSIPIVNGTLLFNTAPIFIPLFAYLFLNKNVEKSVWLAVVVGFVGIVIIIKPTEALFTQGGNFIGLASGMSLAIAYLLMKILTETDSGLRIIFYYLAIGTILQIPLVLLTDTSPTTGGAFYASLSGLLLLCAQIALVTAYKYAEASQVGVYQYSTIVFIGFLDWLIWGTFPTLLELVGVLLVAAAGILIIRSNSK